MIADVKKRLRMCDLKWETDTVGPFQMDRILAQSNHLDALFVIQYTLQLITN